LLVTTTASLVPPLQSNRHGRAQACARDHRQHRAHRQRPGGSPGADDALQLQFGKPIASVIHLAGYYSFSGDPDPRYTTVNVLGTRRLLRGLQAFEVEQFVFASTLLVHAPTQPGQPIREDSPLQAQWAYPQSKLDAEQQIHDEHGHVPCVILRLAGVYNDNGDLPALVQQIARIRERALTSHVFPGDLRHGQPSLHLDDLVDLVAAVVEQRRHLPDDLVLLAGEPETPSYEQLQIELGWLIHGEAWETREIPKALAKTVSWLEEVALPESKEPFIKHWMVDMADDHYELDIGRARSWLGWQPRRRLLDTLPRIVESLERDPEAWYRANHLTKKTAPPPKQAPPPADRPGHEQHMLLEMHHAMLWPHHVNAALGCWLITSPFVLGYLSAFVPDANATRAMLERGLASTDMRNLCMTWNDALIGMLLIAFSVLVPTMPGMSVKGMTSGPDVPPGWNYSPSTFVQRFPIAVLALVGFLISRYLAAYQLGHTDRAWDPFFGHGTMTIVTSDTSKAWPIADAGLGAVAYALELLMAVMGTKQRWRTMPWMVLAFGVLVAPLGGVSIFFIIIQPIVIGTWCSLCLLAAAAMLVMIPYSLDELVSTGQFLLDAHRRRKPFWRAFWLGDTMEGGQADPSPGFAGTPREILREMRIGVAWPWTLVASIFLGATLLFTRLLFDSSGAMANSDHLVGSLVITVSVVATAEVARALRLVNIGFALWLIAAPWWLGGVTTPIATAASLVVGVLLVGLALPRGTISNRYGGWDRFIV